MSDMKVSVYHSSDYAGADTPTHGFYYGYETARCNVCGEDGEFCDTHEDADCDWCFTVTENSASNKTLLSIPSEELGRDKFDVQGCLIAGLAIWGSK
jgi:hypothetical protein